MMLTWAIVIHCEICLLLSLSFYSSASALEIFWSNDFEYVCKTGGYFFITQTQKKL